MRHHTKRRISTSDLRLSRQRGTYMGEMLSQDEIDVLVAKLFKEMEQTQDEQEEPMTL